MRGIPFDTKAGEFECGMAVWIRENGEDNSIQLERLHRNLKRARAEELTPRQQEILLLRYEKNLRAAEIARKLGVHPSTVSRTLKRAKNNLKRVLKYSI